MSYLRGGAAASFQKKICRVETIVKAEMQGCLLDVFFSLLRLALKKKKKIKSVFRLPKYPSVRMKHPYDQNFLQIHPNVSHRC